jgi:DNA-binding NarL/FixJ family response regulator
MAIVAEHADLGFILLDLDLPDRDGFAVLSDLRKRYPAISVVVLADRQDRNSVVKALDLGVLGFIPKSSPREVMLAAIGLASVRGWHLCTAGSYRGGRTIGLRKSAANRSTPGAPAGEYPIDFAARRRGQRISAGYVGL